MGRLITVGVTFTFSACTYYPENRQVIVLVKMNKFESSLNIDLLISKRMRLVV